MVLWIAEGVRSRSAPGPDQLGSAGEHGSALNVRTNDLPAGLGAVACNWPWSRGVRLADAPPHVTAGTHTVARRK